MAAITGYCVAMDGVFSTISTPDFWSSPYIDAYFCMYFIPFSSSYEPVSLLASLKPVV